MVDEPHTSETSSTIATKDTVSTVIEQPESTMQISIKTDQTETLAAESSSLFVAGDGREKSLELSDKLMETDSMAVKDGDYTMATDCFSRAVEIRVAHYGELSPECVNPCYKYGCTLLSKAEQEAVPLGVVPKKEAEFQQDSYIAGSVKNAIIGESFAASVSTNSQQDEGSNKEEGASDDASTGKDQEEDEVESDVDHLPEADEDESNLDLAWKLLDVARTIVERHSGDTMEKVDILSSLAEVAQEIAVVGRGVKRVSMNSGTAETNPTKKPALNTRQKRATKFIRSLHIGERNDFLSHGITRGWRSKARLAAFGHY